MENLNYQVLHGLYHLLNFPAVNLIINNSFIIGFITGSISLMRFMVRRIPHLLVLLLGLALVVYVCDGLKLTFLQFLYARDGNIFMNFIGNYIIGYAFGCAIANLIQRIQGEHDYAND